ncbi:MAG TPA: YdeI/OmpD-associated family protein [Solirubrobacteraceae bacterium]|nr:YdeI/OmpD-associated family protein [Solirubrobacteraceae bacterium]
MATGQELPIVEAPDQRAWRKWLAANHDRAPGAWLKFAKKGSRHRTVDYAAALEEALCFGWIDGQVRRFDQDFYLQRFTPRRKSSRWSQLNREKATRLIEEGRMQPSGLAQVEAAKADGRWEAAYPAQSQATVPDDFQQALDENPAAARFFATLSGAARYAFLYRLHNAHEPKARARRIADYVKRLSAGKTLTG